MNGNGNDSKNTSPAGTTLLRHELLAGPRTPQLLPTEGKQEVTDALLKALEDMETQQRTPENRQTIRDTIASIRAQQTKGRAKYGRSLQTWNGRDPLADAIEEDVDRMQYLTQARLERADLIEERNRLRADLMELEEKVLHLKALHTGNTYEALTALCALAYQNSKSKGFWQDPDQPEAEQGPWCIPEKLALIHSEVSEALEEYRNDTHVTKSPIYYNDTANTAVTANGNVVAAVLGKPLKPEGIAVELADVLVRVFDLCGRFGWNLGKAVSLKMEYNATRPFKHGGKKI